MIGRRRADRAANRLSVDNERCRRYGFCVADAPELFELTSTGGLRHRRTVTATDLEAARAAVRICPTLAITLTETGGPVRGGHGS